MSPYLALCIACYSAGAAIALLFAYYGPEAAITALIASGLLDVS